MSSTQKIQTSSACTSPAQKMSTYFGSKAVHLGKAACHLVLIPLWKGVKRSQAYAWANVQGSAEAELAYARLEALCQAVKVELQQDLHIHDAAVLPNFVNVPKIAAAEYGRVSTQGYQLDLGLSNDVNDIFAVISIACRLGDLV